MQSAFGVEHGEVSKARRNRPTPAQVATRPRPGAVANPTMGRRVAGKLHKIGSAEVSLKNVGSGIARGLESSGRFIGKRPGLFGTAAVGGAGAAGYKYLRDKEPSKKRVAS